MRVLALAATVLLISCGAASAPGVCASDQATAGLPLTTKGWKTDFCKHSVPIDEIRSGGQPRDGIPPIDAPVFTTQHNANGWIRDVEPVISLEIEGQARAYPLQILVWHEIVNDEFAGSPIAVTFCPLCYAAMVFRRPDYNGKPLSFGTSGNLRKSDMVMWDRQTESWWQQFEGTAIVGELTGAQLQSLPASIVSWKDFKASYPDGEVLSRETGVKRAYGRNPYVGYDDIAKKPFLYKGAVGEELAPMRHVVGVDTGSSARAYPVRLLRERRVLHDEFGDKALVVLWSSGTSSALDTATIAGGADAGATGVFLASLDGRSLTFTASGEGRFLDQQTGSAWNVLGHATSGPLAGRRLTPIVHHRVFWFAWSAFVGDRGSVFASNVSK